jgi:hypothetical protein
VDDRTPLPNQSFLRRGVGTSVIPVSSPLITFQTDVDSVRIGPLDAAGVDVGDADEATDLTRPARLIQTDNQQSRIAAL